MKRHKLELMSIYDYTRVEKRLESMARKGWRLSRIGRFFWTYEDAEPASIHYNVTYFPAASFYDSDLSDKQKEYQAMGEDMGWKLVCTSGPMQVFSNEAEDPVPLDTDPMVQVETYHEAIRKNMIPSNLVLVGVALLNLLVRIPDLFRDPVYLLSQESGLFGLACFLIMFLSGSYGVIKLSLWYRKARKLAEVGLFHKTTSAFTQDWTFFLFLLLLLAVWACSAIFKEDRVIILVMLFLLLFFVLMNVAINLILSWMKKKGKSRKANFRTALALAIVFSVLMVTATGWLTFSLTGKDALFRYSRQEEVAKRLPHLLEPTARPEETYEVIAHGDESFLLGRHTVWESVYAPSGFEEAFLTYTITEVKVPFLYETAKGSFLKKRDQSGKDWIEEIYRRKYEAMDPEPWCAREAYQLVSGEGTWGGYILCYDSFVIELQTAEEIGEVEMKRMGEVLVSWKP